MKTKKVNVASVELRALVVVDDMKTKGWQSKVRKELVKALHEKADTLADKHINISKRVL